MKVIPLQMDGKTPRGGEWTLDGEHREGVFGRGEDVAFRVDDGSLSPHHAHFSWQSGTLVVRDLDSINGISRAGRKVRRMEFSGEAVIVAGNVPLKIVPGKGDAAARFRSRLMRFALVLATVAVALVVVKIVSEYAADRGPAAEEEEEPIVPIEPAPPSPEQQEQLARIERSRALVEKAVDALSNGEPPEGVAGDLISAVRLYDDPSGRAQSALVGLQARYAAPHLEAAAAAAKKRNYAKVDEEIAAAEVYYAEPPEEIRSIRALVDAQRTYEKIFSLMKKGRIEDAAALADKLDPSLVPEAEDLARQIDLARQAAAWEKDFAGKARAGDIEGARKLLEEEGKWGEWLTPPQREDFAGGMEALRKVEKLLAMYETDDIHDLLLLDPDDHGLEAIQKAQEALAERCRRTAEEDRRLLEEAERVAGDLSELPADETEARGSQAAEMPAARLYWGGGRTKEAKERFATHHARWSAYVRRVLDRTDAFVDLGSRPLARETLQEVLQDLSDDSPGVGEIFVLADDLGLELPSAAPGAE